MKITKSNSKLAELLIPIYAQDLGLTPANRALKWQLIKGETDINQSTIDIGSQLNFIDGNALMPIGTPHVV